MRHPLLTISAFAAAAAGVACVGGNSLATGPMTALTYAVLFGQLIASDSAFDLMIRFQGFADSADALANANALITSPSVPLNGTTFYFQPLYVAHPQVLYVNVDGSAIVGTKEVTDTVRAIRVRFDSVGGGPHDSLQVNLTLH